MKSEIRNQKSEENPKTEGQTGAKKPYDLRERTLQFALSVLELCGRLPNSIEGDVVRRQLAKSGTSIGANVEEADGALTPKDTRRSFVVARKEAGEARYWLKLIHRRWGASVNADPLIDECTQLMKILFTIVRKLS